MPLPVGAHSSLLGRGRESEALKRLLDATWLGNGGALVLRGEPGIGKSALLHQASQYAEGFSVLRVEGSEFETDLAFAALHQLCRPLIDGIAQLPGAQRTALEAALALSDESTPHRFRAALAVLSLFAEAAAERPVLCLVDDAHWLDEETLHTLCFVARRVGSERVALVIAARESGKAAMLAPLPSLPIGGLDDSSARSLLSSRVVGPLDPRVCDRIVVEARGNPLALLDLSHSETPERLAGGFAVPSPRPVAMTLEEDYRKRLECLPPDTQLLLLAAAAEPTGDSSLLWRVMHRLGIDASAAEPAQEDGLITIDTRVRFRHPLVRSAAYTFVSGRDRRRVHQALAEETPAAVDPDRRAWHRGQAALAPDEGTAADLHAAANRSRARGGAAAAAAFLTLAASLTPDPGRRATRILEAAQAKHDAGSPSVALDLLRSMTVPADAHTLAARAQSLRAQIAFDSQRDDPSVQLLLRAARNMARLDGEAAARTLVEALAGVVFVGRFAPAERRDDITRAAAALPRGTVPEGALDTLFRGTITRMLDGHVAAAPLLRKAVRDYGRDVEHRHNVGWLWIVGSAAMDLCDEVAWAALVDRHVRLARRAGALTALQVGLSYQALVHLHTGAFDRASACADEAALIAETIDSPPLSASDLTLDAWRGTDEQVGARLELRLMEAEAAREGRLVTVGHYARAVYLNSIGSYDEAFRSAELAAADDEMGFHAWITPELVEAAAATGRADRVRSTMADLRDRTVANDTDWARGLELRCKALLADGLGADALFRDAIAHLARSAARAQCARTHLLYGEWLSRIAGRRAEAVTQLHTAHAMLIAMGAHGFALRAKKALKAVGEEPHAIAVPTVDHLTPQERHVARLVATGLTTKEAAAELFVSPRTVDAHLRNIFRKLGIDSRRQLKGVAGLVPRVSA
ncbi:AAA family ATPase [Streptomyces olivaceoviridis]|uniref:AAA family ATPase n=1 Tax=Streptomyces olivaceoviridis TaxID=1921 RepID=UPI003684B64F